MPRILGEKCGKKYRYTVVMDTELARVWEVGGFTLPLGGSAQLFTNRSEVIEERARDIVDYHAKFTGEEGEGELIFPDVYILKMKEDDIQEWPRGAGERNDIIVSGRIDPEKVDVLLGKCNWRRLRSLSAEEIAKESDPDRRQSIPTPRVKTYLLMKRLRECDCDASIHEESGFLAFDGCNVGGDK